MRPARYELTEIGESPTENQQDPRGCCTFHTKAMLCAAWTAWGGSQEAIIAFPFWHSLNDGLALHR